MAKYLRGVSNFNSVEEAKSWADEWNVEFTEYVVLEQHRDGSACIVELQDTPVQHGQYEYKPQGKVIPT